MQFTLKCIHTIGSIGNYIILLLGMFYDNKKFCYPTARPSFHWSGFKVANQQKNKKCLLIFWPAFGCCALQTIIKICFFNDFHAKSWKTNKMQENLSKILPKNVFYCLNTNVGQRFCSQKNMFLELKCSNTEYWLLMYICITWTLLDLQLVTLRLSQIQ